MNKITKKIIAIFTLLVLLLSLGACGSKSFKCGMCGEEKTGKSYKSQLAGEKVTVCEDCYEEINEFVGN